MRLTLTQQAQTMNTISDNEYYHVRYWIAYANMFGRWKIQSGQEIQVHGANVKTQITGPIERPVADDLKEVGHE